MRLFAPFVSPRYPLRTTLVFEYNVLMHRKWMRSAGLVLGLVGEPDSFLVVLVPGDACFFEFDAGSPDDSRLATYFLQITGWAKESNFHNPSLTWPHRFEQLGAIRVRDYEDIQEHLAGASFQN